MNLNDIGQWKRRLDDLRPLPPEVAHNLRAALVVNWTYHSNAIEGNTLTLLETKVVLEGITIGGKLRREHFEAINHRDAIHYMEDGGHNEEPLSEWQLRNLHRLVLKEIDNAHAGVYRRTNVVIAGARHTPPDALQVPEQRQALLDWYAQAQLHPVLRAVQLHADVVKIHPFTDGNGRTARPNACAKRLRSTGTH